MTFDYTIRSTHSTYIVLHKGPLGGYEVGVRVPWFKTICILDYILVFAAPPSIHLRSTTCAQF